MDAWILRLPHFRPTIGGSHEMVVSHISAGGVETVLERLEMDFGSSRLGYLVEDQIRQGRVRLILDLDSVKRLDSTFLAEMVAASAIAERSGGAMVLVSPPRWILPFLETAELDRVLPALDSIAAAVRYFMEQ